MEIGVEISLYPLEEVFAPRIKLFLERLRGAGPFRIVTTSLSTQVFGEYDELMGALTREMRATLADLDAGAGPPNARAGPTDVGAGPTDAGAGPTGKAVFIVKVFGPLGP